MRRDPPKLDDEEEARRLSGRAWGIVLGAWAAFFAFVAVIVLPILFGLCGAR